MKLVTTDLPEVIIIEPRVFADQRGFFFESWHRDKYRQAGIDYDFVQDNHSRSSRGVLRGLHFQTQQAQAKLVRVTRGCVFDVSVDIRRGSPRFGQWVGVELSEENQRQVLVPPGFAHGFCVLSESADFLYKCSDFYAPEFEQGIRWDDPQLAIDWPVEQVILSDKDRNNPSLNDLTEVLPEYHGGLL